MGVQSPFDAIAVQTVLAMHNVRLNDRFLGKTRVMYTREGFAFSPLPSTKIAPSLSHSPLPVLPIFELHGPIRHNGAV